MWRASSQVKLQQSFFKQLLSINPSKNKDYCNSTGQRSEIWQSWTEHPPNHTNHAKLQQQQLQTKKSKQDIQVQKHGIHRYLPSATHHKASWWIKEMHLTSNDSLAALMAAMECPTVDIMRVSISKWISRVFPLDMPIYQTVWYFHAFRGSPHHCLPALHL